VYRVCTEWGNGEGEEGEVDLQRAMARRIEMKRRDEDGEDDDCLKDSDGNR
jgi:hypothetical protein